LLLSGQDVDDYSCLFNADKTTTVFMNSVTRSLNLARAGFAAQLRNQFVDLPEPGRSDGMRLGFQTAGRVGWYSTAYREITALGRRTAFTKRNQTKIFRMQDLAHRGGIVYFGNVHVLRPDAGKFVCLQRDKVSAVALGLVGAAPAGAADDAGQDADRATATSTSAGKSVLVAEYDRRTSRDRRTAARPERRSRCHRPARARTRR